MKSNFSIFLGALLFSMMAYSQESTSEELFLWPSDAINEKSSNEKIRIYEETGDHVVSNIHNPSITPFIPSKEKNTGVAVLIAPGGGHRELWIDHEGYNVAKWFKEKGIAAFVLKYRLANEEGSKYTVDDHSVKDMLRAVQLVRSKAEEWSLDASKIGVMGFSAGGEVAALADMHAPIKNGTDAIGKEDSKPNFHALIYPGRSHRIVPNKDSSPVFIAAGYHDRDDISKGMADLYLKYKELGVLAELHIYAQAGHGFGLRKNSKGAHSKWLKRMYDWMQDLKLVEDNKK